MTVFSAGRVRIALLLVFAVVGLAGLIDPTLALAQTPHALVAEVDGIINPVRERFISRAIEQAQRDQATLLIIELDTPGGLLDSTRGIVEELLEAPLPVAVYVSPRGAQTGSAGTFITAAGHFAVMAPGTNIGAATPISGTGEDLGETLANKVTNAAAALIRSIAQARGRNQDKLEEAVLEAASYSAIEAMELNVVDFIAGDLDDLLAQLHGRTVETAAGPYTLDASDLSQVRLDKNPLEHFLEFISDPNISFILLSIGGLGIVVEVFNPGLIAPGVVGVLSLMLAFLAFGNLPVNWAGVAFILVAIVLAILETQVASFGILGVGSIISFSVGGLLLFTQFGGGSPTLPPVSVNRWLVGGTAGALGLTLLYVVRVIYQSRKEGLRPTKPSLEGMIGAVTGELAPRGVVRVGSETWTAVSEDGSVVGIGETVKVSKIDGLILMVSRQDNELI
jgi:membrane-bound serine protease (ClpP class)